MDLFGADSDSEDDAGHPPLPTSRPKENGVMAFHAGTEQALLVYLRSLAPAPASPAEVLSEIDTFCIERHWMMHVGSEKAGILRAALAKALPGPNPGFALLELGTYCGYSSVLLCHTLLELLPDEQSAGVRVVSLEVDEGHASVARQVIEMAGLSDRITVIVERNVEQGLRAAALEERSVDVLFIDHDKDDYKADAQLVLRQGLLRSGSVVVADNVVMGRIDDYRDWVRAEAGREGGPFLRTELVVSSIEYSAPDLDLYGAKDMEDGVEITVLR